jgi:hypothetical protein
MIEGKRELTGLPETAGNRDPHVLGLIRRKLPIPRDDQEIVIVPPI